MPWGCRKTVINKQDWTATKGGIMIATVRKERGTVPETQVSIGHPHTYPKNKTAEPVGMRKNKRQPLGDGFNWEPSADLVSGTIHHAYEWETSNDNRTNPDRVLPDLM